MMNPVMNAAIHMLVFSNLQPPGCLIVLFSNVKLPLWKRLFQPKRSCLLQCRLSLSMLFLYILRKRRRAALHCIREKFLYILVALGSCSLLLFLLHILVRNLNLVICKFWNILSFLLCLLFFFSNGETVWANHTLILQSQDFFCKLFLYILVPQWNSNDLIGLSSIL